MQLTPGLTIERGQSVTRQTIFDLVANALGGTVEASDLSTDTLDIVSQSLAPTAFPGRLWWDMTEQLMRVFTDVIDNTGCSCWLAFGPDRFEVALLATEPIPFGAAVQLTGDGRKAKLPPSPTDLVDMGQSLARWETAKVVGFQQLHGTQGQTAESGAWFQCAVEGMVWAWHPCNRDLGGNVWLSSTGNPGFDSLISGISGLTGPSGITDVRGGLVFNGVEAVQTNAPPLLTYSTFRRTAGQGLPWLRQPFLGARVMRDT